MPNIDNELLYIVILMNFVTSIPLTMVLYDTSLLRRHLLIVENLYNLVIQITDVTGRYERPSARNVEVFLVYFSSSWIHIHLHFYAVFVTLPTLWQRPFESCIWSIYRIQNSKLKYLIWIFFTAWAIPKK